MNNIRRNDGTYLTDEEMEELDKEIKKAGRPIEEYIKINELKGFLFPSDIGLIKIEKVERKENSLFFDLKFISYMFATNSEYPLSKYFDMKSKICSVRFLKFLNWQVTKNIDNILENVDIE